MDGRGERGWWHLPQSSSTTDTSDLPTTGIWDWLPAGNILLIDEIHTPDSSRYWLADTYEQRHAEVRGLGQTA